MPSGTYKSKFESYIFITSHTIQVYQTDKAQSTRLLVKNYGVCQASFLAEGYKKLLMRLDIDSRVL